MERLTNFKNYNLKRKYIYMKKDASKTLRRKRKENIRSLFLQAGLQNKYRQSPVYQAMTHEY